MANLAQVLKHEIVRLARKQVREETGSMRKAVSQYRTDIAELKRLTKEQQRRIAFLESQESKRARTVKAPTEEIGRVRFSAKGLRSHREKLGISAADYASLVGVSTQTIYLWEREQTRPRRSQIPTLVAVRKLGVREAQRRLERA
jgi:DNA-binding transcriptional regulator YiaG